VTIQCFWLEPTMRARRSLRRYRGNREGERCEASGTGYHNAEVLIEPCDVRLTEHDGRQVWEYDEDRDAEKFRDDPRWPTACACGYGFADGDERQVFCDIIYRRTDTGEEMALRNAPPGAMWDARWYTHASDLLKPDDLHLMVECPGGTWYVDGKSSNGPGWTRTGDPRAIPPTVTASPSIGIGVNMEKYHGWLRAGQLVDA
jgi:hypothetical protein